MSAVVVIGTQWGDEGKGKIVDFLAEKADVVVRYQGGNNAGHTVMVGGNEFKLHLLPSGILYPGKLCVVGNGVVIDPAVMIKELRGMQEKGIDTSGLRVSNRAHVIMPYHRLLDEVEEEYRGEHKIGTTKRGIGPCYMDKNARSGIRMVDLLDEKEFSEKLERNLEAKNHLLRAVYGVEGFDYQQVKEEYLGYAEILRPYVTDTAVVLNDAISAGKKVLFEGAQATLLDLDHGTYPYVTSSHPIAGGACIGAGIGPKKISKVIGVVKAYSTRVGEGPFPTELKDEIGDLIRERGREYGTTTGRPRRCGWLDAAIVRYAGILSGIDYMAITRLDILDGIKTLKLCVGYKYKGEVLKEFPASLKVLAQVEPIYEEMPGWEESISAIRAYDDLPVNCRRYIERLSEVVGIEIGIVSVGPRRDQTIILHDMF
ncbi:Adenylosuccinate synthase [Thermosinus carboxydivorans Nor1]|uniref:Adenylosuccinate synthetase n=1 Tax=Thermosinus carboxydivorans Nor1 TaxID=401526 RepID=A1HRK4_9FIRM|nr:adenylosuccinate synthase [Thermosinus carboxydivorans]EAX47335.1 Adenylosuccinate synthase [Thermosinus carboxydivorans Nor1]